MASDKEGAVLTLLGYKTGAYEMAIACNHPNGVVVSVGDHRVELTREQFLCLFDMMDQFISSTTEL